VFLDEIADKARFRVASAKMRKSCEEIAREAMSLPVSFDFPFESALKRPGMSFICEIKRASPSKGLIAQDFPYVGIAEEYEAYGASAISVLTEPFYFRGDDEHLRGIASQVSVPVLRKDFTVDRYQIFEAKLLGASAVLLICSLLSFEALAEYIELADSLGLSAIAEVHDREEIARAVRAKARIIGVNNRDLRTFSVDISTSLELSKYMPDDVLFVSESGVKSRADVEMLEACGADAVLVGETLMRSADKKKELASLMGGGAHDG